MEVSRLAEIERLNAQLYKLVNSIAGKNWDVPDPAVHEYLKHLNAHFPGYQVQELIHEVRRLMLENEELVMVVDHLEAEVDQLDRYAPNNFNVGAEGYPGA